MNKSELINSSLPIVTEYNDLYENSSLGEVLKQADNNDPTAIYELAYRYRCGDGGAEKDVSKSVELYKKVLKYQRNRCALYRLGYMYLTGEMGEDNEVNCLTYFEAAFELGDPDSAVQLGMLYEYGDFVEQDYNKALELYQFAIDSGRKDAYFNQGEIYRYKNMIEESVKCYNIALENNNLSAALPLGWYYEDGIGVEKDEKKAFELYKCAYEDGNPDSAFSLGRMYYLGRGTEENDAEAFKLFLEASQNGYKGANCFLGTMYGYGVEGVVEKKLDRALEYLSDVSKTYEVNSWYTKGCIYAKENMMDDAMIWLTKAAEAGDENAAKLIEQIKTPKKSLQELAEEGKDPNIMMQYAAVAFANPEQGGFNKAVETIERANQLFPDNLDVKEMYARFMFLKGHIGRKIGAEDDAYTYLRISVETVDLLKRYNFMPDKVRETEVDACMELAEMASRRDDDDFALRMLERTDVQKYPYAAVLKGITHFGHVERFGSYISNDISGIHNVLGSSNWRSPFEEASAYYVLSVIYAHGVQGYVSANVPYAYECIQKCASIDNELAAPELKKYSKGFLGKVSYRK